MSRIRTPRTRISSAMKHFIPALALGACMHAGASSAEGRLFHYIRSNQDGSLPEHIYVYRPDETHVEVAKMVERCTSAAYVTGELDPALNQPVALVGGRLARDASQTPQAWLSYARATRTLTADVPAMNIKASVTLDAEPWRVYDFDLSEITALNAGRAPTREDFTFAVALIWPEEGASELFRNLGVAHARFAAAERHLDRNALRFDMSGALNGALWLDAREGHVLEARFAEPNHVGYRDFRLVLQSTEANAADAWREVRQAHWRDCPDGP